MVAVLLFTFDDIVFPILLCLSSCSFILQAQTDAGACKFLELLEMQRGEDRSLLHYILQPEGMPPDFFVC